MSQFSVILSYTAQRQLEKIEEYINNEFKSPESAFKN